MKKLYKHVLTFFAAVGIATSANAQTITSATYSSGAIESDINYVFPSATACFGTLSVTVPAGETVYQVDVSYDYTAGSGAYMSEQRSWINCPTSVTAEAATVSGSGFTGGTQSYSRSISVANGIVGGNVDFELMLGRTWGSTGCTAGYNFVPDGTWTIDVYSATCIPVNNIMLGALDNDSVSLGWLAGGTETMWNVELGTAGFTPGTSAELYSSSVTNLYDTIGGLTQLTNYDVYVQADCGADSSGWVGPISFTTAANCPDVSGITLDYATADSLVVSWTSNGSETMWDMEYGPVGYVPGAGTMSSITSTVDTVGGLMQETEYDIYVRSDCGGVDQGVWIGPLTVMTTCDPFTVFPYIEDFEGTYPGWKIVGANTTWDIGVPTGGVISSAANGNNAAVTNLAGNYNNSENGFLLTACFDFTALVNPVLTFNLNYNTENGWDEGWVDVTTNDGATWTRLGTSTSGYSNWYNDAGNNWWEASSNGWVIASHPLAAYAGMANVRFRIAFSSDGSVNGYDGIGVDDFMIVDEPCARPTGFASVISIADTLVVGWTAGGTETIWNIEYGPVGYTPGTGTSYSTTNNPDTIIGLADGLVLDFYITADCGGGSESVTLSPTLITTPLINDFACGAIFVPVDASPNSFSNIGATTEASESFFGLGNTVWFKTVVPASGHFAITTCGSPIRTELNVYDSVPDCNDLSTTSNYLTTTSNAYGCGFGYASGEICNFNAGDTVYFTMDSYSFGDGEGVFSMILFDLEYEAGTGGVVDACAGDTVNLESYNSGTVSLFPGYWDYPANPNVIFDDSLANTSNFTLGAADAFYIVGNTCMQDTAIVTVNVATASNSGVAIDPFNGCNTGDVFLMDGLTGTIDAGGSWNDDLNTGLLVGGVFVANGLPVGQYQFTYTADNGACPAVSTQVTVDLNNCVGVEENIATFNLFPNPNNGSFFITSSTSDIANITITDAQGKLISTQQINLEAGLQSKMEVSSVESGLYLISIEIAGAVSTQTFIIK